MSVGKGDDASEGASDEYDEEEEDDEDYDCAAQNGGARGSELVVVNVNKEVCLSSRESDRMRVPPAPPPPQNQPQQQRTAAVASSSGANRQANNRVTNKYNKESGSPVFFLGSFTNLAAAHSEPSSKEPPTRPSEPMVNNYYTSLLTSFPAAGFSSAQDHERRVLQTADQSLRQILSDPISGELMDDAMIFPCGHSFGSAGIQRIQETHACFICQAPTRVDTGATNFALRVAVRAFRQDQGIPKSGTSRSAKRRREQDGGESFDGGRNKGVQFPYVVSDKVLIKGNKRTPERFVGKEAIITTQCLNGWYLVRTIENGESVRLQYRSLQKIEG